MFEIEVSGHFDAAHSVRGYRGADEPLHGHRYDVKVAVRGKKLNDIDMLYDFAELKKHLRDALESWDHAYINETPPFDKINATAENMAVILYQNIKERIGDAPVELCRIEVWETPTNHAIYYPDD
jgi:6-pyruvoyltetrahydropterin/6-carboxytetrahydropterin synthase